MKHKKLKLMVLQFGLGLAVHAQQAVIATGGNASGSGGTVAYSVGQIVYKTNIGPNGSVSNGIQQAFEISTLTGIEDNKISLNLQVYPNPTNGYLTLSIDKTEFTSFNFQLTDNTGKVIESKVVTSPNEIINMECLAKSVYFLKVSRNDLDVKTFKIIKN
jgi:hypothetical protein